MKLKRFCLAAAFLPVALWGGTAEATLTGQYLFENNVLDTSGLGRNGTAIGSPTFTSGLYTGSTSALLLDGASQSVELPANTDFIRNAPGATLAAWVRLDGGTGTRSIMVVNNGNTASATGIGDARAIIQIDGGSGMFRALGRQADSGGSSSAVGFTPQVGETYFVAGVFDYVGGAIRLYVDGMQVSSTSVPTWNANSADSANLVARIGSHANGTQEFWPGVIDGARIFNRVLSAEQILGLYNNPNVIPPPLMLGDTDGNGVVNLTDLLPIRQNYLQSVTLRSQGDLTGDNFVDFADFRQWKTAAVGAGSSLEGVDFSFLSVPEPGTAGLAMLGIIGWAGWRRGRRGGSALAAS